MWMSFGGFHETGPDNNHVYNSHIVVDNHGEIKAVYRKVIHCILIYLSTYLSTVIFHPNNPILFHCFRNSIGYYSIDTNGTDRNYTILI